MKTKRKLKKKKTHKINRMHANFKNKRSLTNSPPSLQAISDIENGRNNLTEQMIRSIWPKFNVKEQWLPTGEGEIFLLPSHISKLIGLHVVGSYTSYCTYVFDKSSLHISLIHLHPSDPPFEDKHKFSPRRL